MLALQHRQQRGVLVHEQADGQHPARANRHARTALETDLAVATQTDGVDLHRLHHGAPLTDQGTVLAQGRHAVAHHRDVGGGAAHVGHDGVLGAGQRTRAEHAGRGPGQHGGHGALQRALHVDQTAIALDHHQRRLDAALAERGANRFDHALHEGDHAGVQRGGERAPRRAQAAGQLVPAGDGLVAQLAHPSAQLHFVGAVANREGARNGEGADPAHLGLNGRFGSGFVQWAQGLPGGVVSAGQRDNGVVAQELNQAAGLDLPLVVTRQQHAHRRTFALDHRVGREGGGQAYQVHRLQLRLRQLGQSPRDALRQIEMRRQALGGGDDLLVFIQQHRVGECAAGVDTQTVCHKC